MESNLSETKILVPAIERRAFAETGRVWARLATEIRLLALRLDGRRWRAACEERMKMLAVVTLREEGSLRS